MEKTKALLEVRDFDKRQTNNMEQGFERKSQKKAGFGGGVGGSQRRSHSNHESKGAERKLNSEAALILEVKKKHEEEWRRSFGKDAAAWDQTGKKGGCSNDELWNWPQSNDTMEENLLNDDTGTQCSPWP